MRSACVRAECVEVRASVARVERCMLRSGSAERDADGRGMREGARAEM